MSRLLSSQRLRLRHPISIRLSSTFQSRPSPPKLPADQQAEFERLQRAAAVSDAFQPDSPSAPAPTAASSSGAATTPSTSQLRHTSSPTAAVGKEEEAEAKDVNQGLFRGAPPEFDGDVNPKTGEVGGPKNEPLRWGGQGDWSYNGRVTDF